MVLTDQTKREANGHLIMWGGGVRLSVNLNSIDILETTGTLAVDFLAGLTCVEGGCLCVSIVHIVGFRIQFRSVVSHIHGRGHL